MDSKGISISEKTIYNILRNEGFPRLPRRTKLEKADLKPPKIAAEKSVMLDFSENEEIKSTAAGVLCLLTYNVMHKNEIDFDLTMSILTHNLFRLLARDLTRYEKISDQTLYEKFLLNSADISVGDKTITVKYKKKRNLPLLLETMQEFKDISYKWLGNKQLIIEGASYS
jgi:hypothetical protein